MQGLGFWVADCVGLGVLSNTMEVGVSFFSSLCDCVGLRAYVQG